MRGMRGALARVLAASTVAAGLVVGLMTPVSATPTVCGWVTVTVDGDPHDVPYIEECHPPCGGIDADLGHHDLGIVVVEGWLCVRNL